MHGDPMNFEDVKQYLAYRVEVESRVKKSWLRFLWAYRYTGFLIIDTGCEQPMNLHQYLQSEEYARTQFADKVGMYGSYKSNGRGILDAMQ